MMMKRKSYLALAGLAFASVGCAAGLVDDAEVDSVETSPAIPGPAAGGTGALPGSGSGSSAIAPTGNSVIDPACKVRLSYTDAGELAPLTASYDDTMDYTTATFDVSATLENDPAQEMQIQIWHERGVFYSPEIALGTYNLSGETPTSCSFCIFVHADKQGNDFAKHYFAVAGQVHVDDAWSFTLDVRVSDLVLKEYDPSTMQLVSDSACQIAMGTAEIKTAIPAATP